MHSGVILDFPPVIIFFFANWQRKIEINSNIVSVY